MILSTLKPQWVILYDIKTSKLPLRYFKKKKPSVHIEYYKFRLSYLSGYWVLLKCYGIGNDYFYLIKNISTLYRVLLYDTDFKLHRDGIMCLQMSIYETYKVS